MREELEVFHENRGYLNCIKYETVIFHLEILLADIRWEWDDYVDSDTYDTSTTKECPNCYDSMIVNIENNMWCCLGCNKLIRR